MNGTNIKPAYQSHVGFIDMAKKGQLCNLTGLQAEWKWKNSHANEPGRAQNEYFSA